MHARSSAARSIMREQISHPQADTGKANRCKNPTAKKKRVDVETGNAQVGGGGDAETRQTGAVPNPIPMICQSSEKRIFILLHKITEISVYDYCFMIRRRSHIRLR